MNEGANEGGNEGVNEGTNEGVNEGTNEGANKQTDPINVNYLTVTEHKYGRQSVMIWHDNVLVLEFTRY